MPESGKPSQPNQANQANDRAEQARQMLARAAQLRRQAQELQRRHNDLSTVRKGQAQPPHRQQMLDQMAAERDAKREEASRLEQEAEQMLR